MADRSPHQEGQREEEDEAMFDPNEAEEVVEQGEDAAMDSGEEDEADGTLEEIALQNDSSAHFDHHKDSIFCIAQHPTRPELVATGGGDDIAYLWDCTPPDGPLLPASYESNPQPVEREGQQILASLDGHEESVNAIAFTQPAGEYVVTGTLDGRLSAFATPPPSTTPASPPAPAKLVGFAKEVEEINWIQACPHPDYPNTIAFGASDGSVWVYTINAADPSSPVTIVQTFFLHQAPCTAGAWTPDGKLLATVAEDSSLFVWDVFGDAAAAGLVDPTASSQAVVSKTGEDERFFIEGGLYSVAISPGGGIVAVGGAGGCIRIVGLPRLSLPPGSVGANSGVKGAGAKSKTGGAKQAGGPISAAAGQAGVTLASLQAQSDGIETLDFSHPPMTLLAAGSVDGSVALYDAAHNFAVRRHIKEAHEEEAVIKVEFVKSKVQQGNTGPGVENRNWLLTTCGNDGVVRRWDARGGTAAAGRGLVGEWKGHRGGGEGGGILGFVQGDLGRKMVTAGDDAVALVFKGE